MIYKVYYIYTKVNICLYRNYLFSYYSLKRWFKIQQIIDYPDVNGLSKIKLTENQEKVIKDKYLKDAPSVEAWLRGVARNIALAELLYHPDIKEGEIFKNAKYSIKEYDVGFDEKSWVFLLHQGLINHNERSSNFNVFMKNLYNLAYQNTEAAKRVKATEEKFYRMLSNFEFLANSPTLMNAGRRLQQLSACYVLPVGDSIDEIYDAVKNMAIIHQSGGGTGFDFSSLRPANDEVKSTKGIASGPLTFMQIFNKSTDVVRQGGNRRGANMGILRYDHPDIMGFINMKKQAGVMENFNVSVAIDKKFIDAVKSNSEYDLINPRDKEVAGSLNAREVWNEMLKGAWETGDPGYVVVDRLNDTDSNPTPHIGTIVSTNPCVVDITLISTENGMMRMKDIVKKYSDGGIKVATDNRVPVELNNGNYKLLMQNKGEGISFNLISKAFTTGIEEVYKLETFSGYELIATANHKVLTNEGWISLEKLEPERHLVYIQSGKGIFSQNYELPFEVENEFIGGNGRRYRLNLPTRWSKELGQVMGWLVGDGWLKENKNLRVGFTFGNGDFEVLAHLKPIINSYYGSDIKEIKEKNGVYHLSYHSKYFVEFFKKLGVKTVKAAEKVVPESIFTAPKEAVVGFLQGLFSADGTVNYIKDHSSYVRLTSKSIRLLKDVQLLLLNLGIKSKIYNRSRKERNGMFRYVTKNGEIKSYSTDGVCYELEISKDSVLKFLKEIGFICNKHGTKIANFGDKKFYKDYFEEKIKSIALVGKERVYDLTEPRTLSFITNGIVSLDCGEVPLLPYEPCNLGSINLSKFLKEDESDFDYEKLGRCVVDCVHFLDNVIDVNNYPLPEIEEIAKTNRRIGLGVMGWAESLVKLGIPYNDERALEKAEEVMKFINDNALIASEQLARERGVFANWKGSIFDKNSRYFRGNEYRPRNCARTTIAPTGTIGIAAGLQGAGIEPFFAIVYTRYNAAGIDALKLGKMPAEKDVFFEANPLFEEIVRENNYFGLKKEDLWKKIDENHKSIVGIKEIPVGIQRLFLTSHDLSPMDHVKIQAAFQKYTNNAISKTVNLRNEATIKDVEEVYMSAYELGCKGVTIYRDGSKAQQVLNLDKKEEKKKREYNGRELSEYYEIQTGQGPLHVHINYNEEGPTKVFANISPAGTEISGMTTAIAILLSKYFELGGDPVRVLKHLNSIKGDKPFGFGDKRVDSTPHAISKALRSHLIKTGKIEGLNEQGQTKLFEEKKEHDNGILEAIGVIYCPKCYSSNVGMVSGCSKPTCFDCGYSECG